MLIVLIILALIVVFAFIVMNKAKDIARTNEEWMRAAGKLKLAFKKAGGILDTPRLGGEIEGFPVSVHVTMEKRGDRIVPFTTYVVNLPEGSNIESVLDKASAKIENVRTGHPLIDKLLAAGGFDRGKLRLMMSDAKDAAIAKFSKSCPNLSVTDNRIVCKFEGVDSDADMVHARISQLLRLAKAISWKGGASVHTLHEAYESPEEEEPLTMRHDAPLRKTLERSAKKPFSPPPVVEAPQPEPQPQKVEPSYFGESRHASESKAAGGAKSATESRLATMAKPAAEVKSASEARSTAISAPSADAQSLALDCADSPDALAKALFSNALPGQAEKTLFERVKGSRIAWSGTLKMVQEYGMDFNFQGGAGTKAVLEICEVAAAASLKVRVKAVVQLPKEASQTLKPKIGQNVAFEGTLFKFEPFAKEIYVSGGAMR